jgi:protein O-mannosyl-transferase
MPESVKKSFVIFTYFVLILSTLLVFWQVRNFDFVKYDDGLYIYENPHVLNGLTEDGVIWAFTTNHSANWHPLTWLSLMLDCQLFGANPGWMHLMNLILHLANTLLLFAVFRKMTGALWQSAFVAAAFAIHPMHVESVAWIAERKDVLSTLFLLLTLAAYVSYVRRPGLVRYVLTVLLFASGLLAKPMLVTLPFLLLLLDYWPLGRFDSHQTIKASSRQKRQSSPAPDKRRILYRAIIEKIPFIAFSVVSSVITFLVQRSGGAMVGIDVLPLKLKFANAFLSYARYISKMFWPQNLAVFYPFDVRTIQSWQVVLCALLMIVVSVLAIRFGRKQRYLPVGWFWFVGTLIPVIGLVQVGGQSLADRYTYISYIGLFIMIAWGLPELLSKWPQRKNALGLSMVIVLTTLGICAHRQVSFWNNSLTLFSHAIEVTQNNYIAHDSIGVAYNSLGRYQDAIESYKQAIKIKPDYADAHYNLGVACGKLGRWQDAVESYKQAIKIKPDYTKAHYNLGISYEGLGRYQDAIEAYKQAIRIEPDYADAYINLGVTYYRLGRYKDAVEPYKQAIRIRPDIVLAHYNLGVAYLVTGDKSSALEEYKILKTLDAEQANELLKLINK